MERAPLQPTSIAQSRPGCTIGDYAGNGLDSGKFYLGGLPAASGANGLMLDNRVAFPGINPLVGENEMLFSSGRSTYTALQMKLVQNMTNPLPGVKHGSFQFSYALSRFNTMARDQDFLPVAFDYRDPGRYYGPGSLDRTHQFSFGGTFNLAHGPQLSMVGHFSSPLSNNLAVSNETRAGEIFFTDYIGDGAEGAIGNNPHLVPGQQLGSWGRSVNPGNINALVNNYNNTVAGKLLPAGQSLVDAGLFTTGQLQSLGAVADTLAAAPTNEFGMTWMRGFDFKFAWPIRVREGVTIEPAVSFYNLFNLVNFNAPGNLLGGTVGEITSCPFGSATCDGSPNTATGTPNTQASTNSLRIGTGTGASISGAPRQIEFGMKLTF